MMKLIASLAVTAALLAPSALAMSQDDVRRCNAMAASFKAKKAEYDAAQKVRDARATAAEAWGEDWENAEALRSFGEDHASKADAAKAAYDAAKSEFSKAEMAAQSIGRMLNDDIAAYNASCAAD